MRNPPIKPAAFNLPLLVAFLLTAGGCTSTRVLRVAPFEPGRSAGPVHRPAPQSAAYKVKYADAAGKELKTVGGSKRIVGRGEPLGFGTSPDGKIIAVAGDEQFPLESLPPTTRFCVWTSKQTRQTQFSKEVGKAAVTAVAVPVVGALLVGTAYLDAQEDDCDEEEKGVRERRRRDEEEQRIDRWMKANQLQPSGWRPGPAPD